MGKSRAGAAWQRQLGGSAAGGALGGAGGDEYSDEDDVGYVSVPVLRQDDFAASELQGSDGESDSTRSAYGFHRCTSVHPRPLI